MAISRYPSPLIRPATSPAFTERLTRSRQRNSPVSESYSKISSSRACVIRRRFRTAFSQNEKGPRERPLRGGGGRDWIARRPNKRKRHPEGAREELARASRRMEADSERASTLRDAALRAAPQGDGYIC